MARITIEDCLDHVDNRFDLVIVASRRARQVARGAQPLVAEEGDKPTVLALREIASGLITREVLDELDAKQRAAEEYEMAERAYLEQEAAPPLEYPDRSTAAVTPAAGVSPRRPRPPARPASRVAACPDPT